MERTKTRRAKRIFTSRMQARLLLVFCVIIIVFTLIIARLIYINMTDGERYKKKVLSRQSYVNAVTPFRRGEIKDRNGTSLARSELKYKLILDPNMLLLQKDKGKDYIEPTMNALKEYFEYDNDSFRSVLQEKADSQYVVLLKELEYNLVEEFKEFSIENKNIKGIWFEEEYVRSYPYSNVAPDLIGFVTSDNVGFWGIEEYYNNELNGINGREYGYYNSNLNIERIVKPAQNGNTIISTIDINIQNIVQKHIKEFNDEYGSKNIGIAIMNPNTGEIIAMASNEEYDLNNPRDLSEFYSEQEINQMSIDDKMEKLNIIWGNNVISDGFEPGSTFKPFTVSAALEENIINNNSTFYCSGSEHVGGVKIRCNKAHGDLSLEGVIMFSCNSALMQIAEKEGKSMFYDYQKRFMFGEKTGIDLPGESTGILVAKDQLNATELATSSFGQSMNVTMIQMMAAYSSIVNGGNYYKPHIVKEIVNDKGAIVKAINKTIIKKTVSENTSDLMKQYLLSAVEGGTAKGAKVDGYMIGGKTGTAQKLPRDAKTYILSFIGGAPALNPEMVIYVVIDEAQNVDRKDDSSLATKLASRVMKDALPALGIYPEGDIEYVLPEMPEVNEEEIIEEEIIEEEIIEDEINEDDESYDNIDFIP
ncbi:MAG TPA: peptidoglycan glycosyltransferase [Clostridiales bacterium]|nr:peptidoglycan glycosyltransferase [Clostridiales bacterium]